MVWGAFAHHGPLPLYRVQGTLRAPQYLHILQQRVFPELQQHPAIQFQQDNAPCHKAHVIMAAFEEEGIRVMDWPPCSPDLNPIENYWAELKRQLDQQQIHGFQQLFETADQLFQGMHVEFIENLIGSMPRRMAEVIRNKGGHTKY